MDPLESPYPMRVFLDHPDHLQAAPLQALLAGQSSCLPPVGKKFALIPSPLPLVDGAFAIAVGACRADLFTLQACSQQSQNYFFQKL